jgi:type I restriction enzyme S subunit
MNAAPKRIEVEELPEGWIETNLNAAVENMKNGLYKAANAYAEQGVACLRMYNIDGGRIIWKNIKRMLLTSDEVNEYRLAPGDLLVNRVNSRELVGKTAVFPKGLEPCIYESKNIRVRLLSELVNSDFVNYQLLLFGQHHFNYNSQQVVGMASISQPQIGDFPLLLPPRLEQDRIASKAQAMLAKLAKSSSHIANVAKILKRFRQAVLAAACSGRLTQDWRKTNRRLLEEDWREAELLDMCSSISDGDHQPPPKQTTGVPFLTIGNVSSGCLDFSETRFVPKEYFNEIRPERKPRRGDVLYTVVGATIGIPILVDVDRPFCFQRHIALLRPSKETTPEFLWTLMASPEVFKEAWSRVTGSAQPTLPLGNLRTIPISVPPLDEQNEIARRVQALLELADTIQQRVGHATLKSGRLAQSILAKAFRGELVPTEAELARLEVREYESAAMLLERIRSQRADQAKNPAYQSAS